MAGQAKPSEQSAEGSGNTAEDAEHKKEILKLQATGQNIWQSSQVIF